MKLYTKYISSYDGKRNIKVKFYSLNQFLFCVHLESVWKITFEKKSQIRLVPGIWF